MAQFLERCSSCQSPIYLEDSVPGACSCLEGDLRQLLARRRIASGAATPAPARMTRVASMVQQPLPHRESLPELSPEMFLSSGALREVQAAAGMRNRSHIMVDPKRFTTTVRMDRPAAVEVDFDLDMDGAIEMSMGNGPAPSGLDAQLASIWERGVAADLGNDFQVDFSAGDDIDLDTPSRGPLGDPRGSRFRVDRPPPTPAPRPCAP